MKNRTIITRSEGCTDVCWDINGDNLKWDEKNIDFILAQIKKGLDDGTVVMDDVMYCLQYDSDEYEDGSCDTCGTSARETVWEFET